MSLTNSCGVRKLPEPVYFYLKFGLLSVEALEPRPLGLQLGPCSQSPFELREIICLFGKSCTFHFSFFLAQISLLAS